MRIPDPDEIASLLEVLSAGPRDTFADIGGNALSLGLAAMSRWDCALYLVDINPKGIFPKTRSEWIEPYLAALKATGMDVGQVTIVSRAEDLQPWDIIANFNGFGDTAKVKHLSPILARCFHADSKMVSDIRKGSGSYPFLNDYGQCETLWTDGREDKPCARVIFTPNAQGRSHAGGAADVATDWAGIARDLAGPDGFYRESPEHSFVFIPRDPNTLVVTFDNLDIAMGKREDRRPWGFGFIEKQGWSMLGVMANGWTWYRDPWVWAEFDRLASDGFFKRFDRVAFYGASMGGYAACAFAAASPGCEVVAISPQSTLDKSVVPWETRYKIAWDRDFSGAYGDAATASRAASQVTILFDPYEPLDRGHAERFTAANARLLRAPLLGHRLGSSLSQMGVLSPVVLAALDGRLEAVEFYRLLRARHGFARYQRELFLRALDRGRPELARRVGAWVLRQGDNRFIRQAMAKL
ncbi:MAG: hypothetical protein WBC90_00850 [Albidovulum sp.]